MPERTFGQALGALILQKRRAAGLTQTQLAEDAFQTTAKTRRISELENGTVANPHPKTIDPIISILKISEAELEECAKQAAAGPDENLDRAYREAKALIDSIARRFEFSKPNASLAELDEFLREKAKEWAALRTRIDAIDTPELRFAHLKTRAAAALSRGDFDEVDELLSEAEEQYQRGRTLSEVRRHAAIRITRGDACILSGDTERALSFYLSAAEFYRPFDENEMASVLHEIAGNIYDISRRSLDPPFLVAAKLLETLVGLPSVHRDRTELATAHFRLGLIYRNKSEQDSEDEVLESLNKAIFHGRQSIEYLDEKEAYQVVSAKTSLANCLSQRGVHLKAADDVREAIALLEGAKTIVVGDRASAELIPHISNSLGAALLNLYYVDRDTGDARADVIDLAIKAFRAASDASEYLYNVETWSAAKGNMGSVLGVKSRDTALSDDRRRFLRIRAIAEYEAAVEAYAVNSFHTQFAEAQSGLGVVLLEQAISSAGQLKEVYLGRCLHALTVATSILTEERDPIRWAEIRIEMGNAFVVHARMEGVESSVDDYEEALSCFREAFQVLSKSGSHPRLEACGRAIERVEGELRSLETSGPSEGER